MNFSQPVLVRGISSQIFGNTNTQFHKKGQVSVSYHCVILNVILFLKSPHFSLSTHGDQCK